MRQRAPKQHSGKLGYSESILLVVKKWKCRVLKSNLGTNTANGHSAARRAENRIGASPTNQEASSRWEML
jgi:hypothetical protein